MEQKKCPHCDKIIRGYSEEHIDYLLKQHILSKHKDKIENLDLQYVLGQNEEQYVKIEEKPEGHEFMRIGEVYQLIDILIKKGVITIKDLNGYKKIKEWRKKYPSMPIKLQEVKNGKRKSKRIS